MIPTTAGVTAPASISQGITLQINSRARELTGALARRRDRWLINTVSNITTKSPMATVVNNTRISGDHDGLSDIMTCVP